MPLWSYISSSSSPLSAGIRVWCLPCLHTVTSQMFAVVMYLSAHSRLEQQISLLRAQSACCCASSDWASFRAKEAALHLLIHHLDEQAKLLPLHFMVYWHALLKAAYMRSMIVSTSSFMFSQPLTMGEWSCIM